MASVFSSSSRVLGKVALTAAVILGLLAAGLIFSEIFPLLLRRGIFLVPLLVLAWIVWSSVATPALRVRRFLSKGRLRKAYQVALKNNCRPIVRDHLADRLPLPVESLRQPILHSYDELNLLHDSSVDESNRFVESDLKRAMRDSTDEGLAALWNTCANLEVVARQQVDFADNHPKIRGVVERLRDLGKSTKRARVKLAELSLGSTQEEVEEARLAMETVRRQSEFLLELETALD